MHIMWLCQNFKCWLITQRTKLPNVRTVKDGMHTCTWVGACSGQYGSVIPRGVGSLILRSSQDYMCSVLCLSLWVLCNANVYVSVYVTWLWSIGCYVSLWVWFCVCYVYYVNIVCMYHVFSNFIFKLCKYQAFLKWGVYEVCAKYLVKKGLRVERLRKPFASRYLSILALCPGLLHVLSFNFIPCGGGRMAKNGIGLGTPIMWMMSGGHEVNM